MTTKRPRVEDEAEQQSSAERQQHQQQGRVQQTRVQQARVQRVKTGRDRERERPMRNDGDDDGEDDDGDDGEDLDDATSTSQRREQEEEQSADGNAGDEATRRRERMLRTREQTLAQLRSSRPFPDRPEARLLIYNIQKASNVGPLIRTSVAIGMSSIFIVGAQRIKTHGHQNTAPYIHMVHFDRLDECVAQLKQDGFTLIGVEIGAQSRSVNEEPFTDKSVFCFGNEATGLNDKILSHCDRLIYIPQFGAGTASLNVTTSAGIIMHRFATWARYPEQARQGTKFVVEPEKRVIGVPSGAAGVTKEEIAKEGAAKEV